MLHFCNPATLVPGADMCVFCSMDWEVLDWNAMGIDWTSAYAAGQHTSTSAAPVVAPTTASVAPAPATTTKAAAPASSTKAASVGGVFDEVVSLFDDLIGTANSFTEFGTPAVGTGDEVAAIGNIGYKQGSNMIMVSSTEGYDFTANFINTSGESMKIAMWNKAYSKTGLLADADPNLGACVAPQTPTLTFALAPNQNQLVAFQEYTIAGFCQATSAINGANQFAITWGELNLRADGSGFDMSAIQNPNGNSYNMTISSAETTCRSDPTQNYWLTDTQPIGSSDGSCFISQSTATLTVEMAGEM